MKTACRFLVFPAICLLSISPLPAQQEIPYRTLEGHKKSVRSVAFSPDGSLLASASDDHTVRIWRVGDGKEICTIAGHEKGVKTVSFSPDGTMLATGSDDHLIKLWRTYDWTEIRTLEGHKKGVNSIAFSPDGQTLVSGSDYYYGLKLWRVKDGSELRTMKAHSVCVEVTSVAISPDGEYVAYTTGEGSCSPVPLEGHYVYNTVRMVGLDEGKVVWKHEGSIEEPIAFSPDGRFLAGSIHWNQVVLWQSSNGRQLWSSQKDVALHEIGRTKFLAFSPDGKILASGHDGGLIRFWKADDGEVLQEVEVEGNVYSVAFSPDGRYLASGDKHKEVRIWDVSSLGIGGGDIASAPPPMYPPVLTGRLSFSEPSGNNLLDAEETAEVELTLTNSGQGVAYGITANVDMDRIVKDLRYQRTYTLDRLGPGATETIAIPFTAGLDIASDSVDVSIGVTEKNGFGLPAPLPLRFSTQELIPPRLSLDYGIDDHGNNNSRIEPLEMVTVTARIQNVGQGKARDVKVEVNPGEHVYIGAGSKTSFSLGELAAGESKDVSFMIYTNNQATSVPIGVAATEAIGGFGFEEEIDLPFNIVQRRAEELVVAGTYHEEKGIEEAPSLTVDVDIDVPETRVKNPNAVAVVIGNRDYEFADIPRAEFARNDASIVREYLMSQFGYSDGNVLYVTDAKLSDFNSIFGTETKSRGKLARYVKPGVSDVFIYYSGHGAPDIGTKKAYFVPVDCDPQAIDVNGYSLDTFYKNISMLDARSMTVVIEACFSGNSGGGSLLKANPVAIKVSREASIDGTVITSSSGDEVSGWYPEKKHSLFTYFFLKGISGAADRDGDRKITVGELQAYITSRTEGVPYWAGRRGITQTPTVHGDPTDVLAAY